MQAYRDQYASLFRDGQDVILIGVSSDPAEELASWARDEDFQFLFASDPGSALYSAFGGDPRDNGMVGSRAVIVVDREGRIADVMPTFNQVDPEAYQELESAIDRVTAGPGGLRRLRGPPGFGKAHSNSFFISATSSWSPPTPL